MATTRSFSAMLNEYLPNQLLQAEFKERSWITKNVEMDDSWLGGSLIVPYEAANASSISFGSLTDSTDIAQDSLIRGSIDTQPEVWGSMIFNDRDIMEHGKLSEQNFLKILPGRVDRFLDYMKGVVGHCLLNGPAICKLTGDGDASGNITVDRPERFVLGQKVYVDDDNNTATAGYVRAINMETGVVNLYDARSGGSAVNLSSYTVSQNAKVYFDGSQSQPLTNLRESLLSAANGGSSTLYGDTKTSAPFLQAINVSGADVTSVNFLQKLFDGFITVKVRGKGMPNKAVMSYRNLGWAMSILESGKGAYHQDQTGTKVSVYGWTEIEVFGPKGKLTLVGVEEMDDDVVFYLDTRPSVMKIYSNGGFKKRKDPDTGKEFFAVRATTGYSYIVDSCFFGDFVLLMPSYCGILHSIPATVAE